MAVQCRDKSGTVCSVISKCHNTARGTTEECFGRSLVWVQNYIYELLLCAAVDSFMNVTFRASRPSWRGGTDQGASKTL